LLRVTGCKDKSEIENCSRNHGIPYSQFRPSI
jgi:hypothetical protein